MCCELRCPLRRSAVCCGCTQCFSDQCFAPVETVADPHFLVAHGDAFDFKGKHNTIYNLVTSALLTFNALFQNVDYRELGPHKRLVHGSYMTSAAAVVRTATGRLVTVEYNAMRAGARARPLCCCRRFAVASLPLGRGAATLVAPGAAAAATPLPSLVACARVPQCLSSSASTAMWNGSSPKPCLLTSFERHSASSAYRGLPFGMNRNTITAATREMIDDALVDVVMPMTKASWAASSKAAPAGWP